MGHFRAEGAADQPPRQLLPRAMKTPLPSDASRTEAAPREVYAVVRHGGHQYRVPPGDRLLVDRLPAEVGAVVGLEPVILLADADGVAVDTASLEGIRIAATVAGHRRGKKIRVFTFKPKKRHRRTLGFRADLTELVVDRFLARGEPLPEPVEVEEPEVEEPEIEKPDIEEAQPAEIAAEEVVEPATGRPAPARRRTSRARAAEPEAADEAGAAAVKAGTEPEAEPVTESEAEPPARRRRGAGAATAAATAVEPETPAPPAPARRARKPAAAALPESAGAEPAAAATETGAGAESEPAPSSGSATGKRRRERKPSPAEEGE
jgi:large subunit ribosomal protein L21